jgi:tetratricopeptide (TPR) repeat protein
VLWQGAGRRENAARSELAAIAALVQLGRHDAARDRMPAATPTESDDPAWQIEYLRVVSSFHAEQGRLKEALAHEMRRVEVARRAGNRRMVAGALANVAMYSSDLGEFGDARALLEEALAEYRRAGDLFNVSVVLTNYGNLLRRIGSVDESIKAQSEARELASALGDDYGVLVSGINIAACHMSLAQYTRAAVEHERALALLRRFKDLPAEAQLRHNTAIVAFRMGDFRNAREQLEQSTALNQRRNNIRGLVQNEQLQAEDFFRTGDLPRAWEVFESCIARAANAGLPRAVSSALQAWAQCALIARDRAQWAGALAQTLATSDPERDQRATRMLQAIDVLLGDPARFAELAALVDPQDQSRDGQLLLAAAVLACAWVADSLPKEHADTAAAWAGAVTNYMRQGGRADTEYASLLLARAKLQTRAGNPDQAAAKEADLAAERVDSTWLVQSKT